MWTDNLEISHVTRSGKGYKPAEKKAEKVVELEAVAEEDLDEPYDNLILE